MKKGILIVTANFEFSNLMETYLSRSFNVKIAGNCEEACILAENGFLPDLIISESPLSLSDGKSLTVKIKENFESKNIRILILTGKEKKTGNISLIRTDDNSYMVKPFRLTDLERRVRILLEDEADNN